MKNLTPGRKINPLQGHQQKPGKNTFFPPGNNIRTGKIYVGHKAKARGVD
jgi:hypothetical protein